LKVDQAKRFTGTPEDKLTYNDWLQRQKEGIQDQVLGKTRAQLFRDGKVDIDKFTNNRGRLLTLPELSKREGLEVDDLPKF
jgi:hypothetical protein